MIQRVVSRCLSLLAGLFFTIAVTAQELAVEPGMSRIQVIQALGEPASTMSRGGVEVLSYRDGAKITLHGGVVSEATGLKLIMPSTEEVSAEATPSKSAPSAEDQAIITTGEAARAQQDSDQRAKFEQAIAEMEDRQANPERHYAPPPFNLVSFVAGLLIKTFITLMAVKLTAKYWGYELLWGGAIIVASVDTAVRTVINMGGKIILGMPSVFYADEAVAAMVMVMLVKKTSTSQSLNQAIQITITTKIFTIIVGSFLATMVLQLF